MRTSFKNRDNSGFSMIEVLVASTILVMIVMMLAMLFQQTSIAWRTGVRRADAFTQVRSVIGAMQRDAAGAVDEKSIEEQLRAGKSQSFSDGPRFFTLSGNGFDDNGTPRRSVSYIEYNGGIRSESFLLADGKWGPKESAPLTKFVHWSGSDTITLIGPSVTEEKSDDGGLPLYVTFKVKVATEGYNLEIGAASAGPDGAWGTKDDIRTWADD